MYEDCWRECTGCDNSNWLRPQEQPSRVNEEGNTKTDLTESRTQCTAFAYSTFRRNTTLYLKIVVAHLPTTPPFIAIPLKLAHQTVLVQTGPIADLLHVKASGWVSASPRQLDTCKNLHVQVPIFEAHFWHRNSGAVVRRRTIHDPEIQRRSRLNNNQTQLLGNLHVLGLHQVGRRRHAANNSSTSAEWTRRPLLQLRSVVLVPRRVGTDTFWSVYKGAMSVVVDVDSGREARILRVWCVKENYEGVSRLHLLNLKSRKRILKEKDKEKH